MFMNIEDSDSDGNVIICDLISNVNLIFSIAPISPAIGELLRPQKSPTDHRKTRQKNDVLGFHGTDNLMIFMGFDGAQAGQVCHL